MKSVLLKILLILSFLPFSQVWGADFIPAITNYTVKDYEGGHQNWACAQGDDGVMYFGNNNGLLVYDGFSWELHWVPGGYIVRSVFVDDDRVYIGSFEEFGYFIRKTDGQMQYHSLSAGIKDKISSNDEIWHIVRLGEKFISSRLPAGIRTTERLSATWTEKVDSALCIFILVMKKFMLR